MFFIKGVLNLKVPALLLHAGSVGRRQKIPEL